MKKTLATLVCLLISLNSFAVDVKPIGLKNGDAYVRVTKLANKKITFEKCIKGAEKLTCKGLGHKKSYSIKELQNQRSAENDDVLYALLADAGLIVVGSVAWVGALGGIGMLATTAGSAGAVTAGQTIAFAGGMSAVTGAEIYAFDALVDAFDAINPCEQARQREAISEDVVNDYDVEVARDEMKEAIERLDFVLSEIR